MVKLPNIFGGDTIGLTQSPHGLSQNSKAIDTTAKPLICPFDGCKTSSNKGSGQQSYFDIILPDK
jgi:hypothetical protein